MRTRTMAFPAVCAIAAAGLVALGARADVPLTLTWSAPPGCPKREAVIAEVERLLAARTKPSSPVTAQASIVKGRGEHHLRIVVETASGGRQRVLTAPTCAELADAAALILAIAINPSAIADKPASAADAGAPPQSFAGPDGGALVDAGAPDAAPSADAGAAPFADAGTAPFADAGTTPFADAGAAAFSDAGAAPSADAGAARLADAGAAPSTSAAPSGRASAAPSIATATPPEPDTPSSTAEPGKSLRAIAAVDLDQGTFRGAVPSFRAGLAFVRPPLRLELAGLFTWGGSIPAPSLPDAGGEMLRAAGSLAACLERALDIAAPFGLRGPRGALCLGFEAGALRATSYGIASPDQVTVPWLAPSIGAMSRWPLAKRLALRFDVGVAGPIVEPAFRILGVGVVHYVGLVTARGGVGVEVDLFDTF